MLQLPLHLSSVLLPSVRECCCCVGKSRRLATSTTTMGKMKQNNVVLWQSSQILQPCWFSWGSLVMACHSEGPTYAVTLLCISHFLSPGEPEEKQFSFWSFPESIESSSKCDRALAHPASLSKIEYCQGSSHLAKASQNLSFLALNILFFTIWAKGKLLYDNCQQET